MPAPSTPPSVAADVPSSQPPRAFLSPSSPPSLPRRPSFSSFTLLSSLRSLHLPAAQWMLQRGASLAAEEAEEGCRLLDVVWEMVRDDLIVEECDVGGQHSTAGPPHLLRSVSSKPATSSSHSRSRDDGTARRRLTLDRRKSTPLPAVDRSAARLPSSSSTYLATSPLATVSVYRGPVPLSRTLTSLLLLLMPHSSSLQLPTLPASPPPSLATLHSLSAFYDHIYPLLLTVHSNTASLALTHAHILDDITHTLAALATQQRREQEEEEQKDDRERTGRQRVTAVQEAWRQKRDELEQERRQRDEELMEYVRERAADVQLEAEWAAERVKQQASEVASEERRVAAEVREQGRLQRRIASMEARYLETQQLSAESTERCQLLARQTSAFSSQLSLLSASLSAERAKSTQDEVDLAAVRLSQQQYCMLTFRPRAQLFRKPLLRDPHPQLRLVLPPSLCLQSSEVVRHTQCPSWAEWRVQLSAVGGSNSRWRMEVWDVEERSNGEQREERLCSCWSTVSEVLLGAGEDVELHLTGGEATEDGEHVGMLLLSAVRVAYI